MLELVVALLLSVVVNFWQFSTTGELRAERDSYESIVEQCTTDRKKERQETIRAADEREEQSAAMGREFARQEQYVRDTVKRAKDTCLDSNSALGSELVDGEQRTTDSLNGVWLRGSSESDD